MAFAKPSCIFALLIISMAIATHGVQSDDVLYSFSLPCEELPADLCAFSVSSTGNRCVLEKALKTDGTLQFQCQSSAVMAEKLAEWIESEECINACGLERMTVGMSTDSLLESKFSRKLCSSKCRNNCPNIVDLYVNLAAGEGISLPSMCESQKTRSRKLIAESLSSSSKSSIHSESYGAPGPYGISSKSSIHSEWYGAPGPYGSSSKSPPPVYGTPPAPAPAPVYGTPSYTVPAPIYGTPSYTVPAATPAATPVYGTPSYTVPAPAPAPVYGTPSYTVPAPVYGTAPAATPIYG